MKRKFKLLLISSTLLTIFLLQFLGSSSLSYANPEPKTSTTIVEDVDEFAGGTLDNLIIDGDDNLRLENNTLAMWKNMEPDSNPGVRSGHCMVYNSRANVVILFGGAKGGSFPNDYLNDTWVYNLTDNTWTNLTTPSNRPNVRYGFAMTYDVEHDATVLFGGGGHTSGSDTWIYNLTENTWTEVSPGGSPAGKRYHSMVYDTKNNKTILYGGQSIGGEETWEYDLEANSWNNLNPAENPGYLSNTGMVYDTANERVILFGGVNETRGFYTNETWVYNYTDNSWTNMTTDIFPSSRGYHRMAYETWNNRTILYGGYAGGGRLVDTWQYNFTDNSWTQLATTTNPDVYPSAMVYDDVYDRIILYGGQSGTRKDDTWIFSSKMYYQQGNFQSDIIDLGDEYDISGNIAWTPVSQPDNTSIEIRIGFSDSTSEGDFEYTSYYNSSFSFEGSGEYAKYRIIFKSNVIQNLTPLINQTILTLTLEETGDDDDDDDDDASTAAIPFGNYFLIFIPLAIIALVLYYKKKKF